MKIERAKALVITLCLCGLCNFQTLHAQLTDLARLEYSFIPSSKSEDQYTRLRLALNYPIKTKEDCYLVVGAEYNRILLNLNEPYPFDASRLDALNIVDLSIGYTFKTSENWRIGLRVTPRIASTWNESLTSDDLFLNGGIFSLAYSLSACDG